MGTQPPDVRERTVRRAGRTCWGAPGSLHAKAWKHTSTRLRFAPISFMGSEAGAACATDTLLERGPDTCTALPPRDAVLHHLQCCLRFYRRAIKKNSFQIFPISVISCTHQDILHGPAPRLNFRIAFQPITTGICPSRFQDSRSLCCDSFCRACERPLQHEHLDARIILPITKIRLPFTTYA